MVILIYDLQGKTIKYLEKAIEQAENSELSLEIKLKDIIKRSIESEGYLRVFGSRFLNKNSSFKSILKQC